MKKSYSAIILAGLIAGCASPKRVFQPVPTKQLGSKKYFIPPLPAPPQVVAPPPLEIEMPMPPGTEYIRREGDMLCYIGLDGLVFWNAQGHVSSLPVTVNAIGKSFELPSSNSIVISGYNGFNDGTVSNCVFEYHLDYSDDLPSGATITYQNWFNPNGRWVRTLKLDNGGIVVATFKWIGVYNLSLAYRSPQGQWSYGQINYGQEVGPIIPAFDLQMQEGKDGNIYIFIGRDSSHNIALARWKEVPESLIPLSSPNTWLALPGKLEPVDFRYAFLTVRCEEYWGGCRDGAMSPDYENPWIKSFKDFNGRILLSYQGMTGSISTNTETCGARLCHQEIVAVDTFPQLPGAHIREFRKGSSLQSEDFPLIANFAYDVTPGNYYTFQRMNRDGSWNDLNDLYTGQVDILATNATMFTRCFLNGESNGAFQCIEKSYSRSLAGTVPLLVERVQTFLPIIPQSDGSILYFVAPWDAQECNNGAWRLFRLFNGAHAEILIDYRLLAWGEGWIIIERGGKIFAKRLS